ncbi:MAG: nuclear transport factor 2 family protein [Betaproteobacteria bacterium]|nr:nuclear transport factor 2 family protein [Betaproteobacteria bacterium]
MDAEAVKLEIKTLEDRRYQAMIAKDAATLDKLLGAGLVYTHSYGGADSKATYMDGVRSKKWDYQSIERPSEMIQVYGDTAVVTGHVKINIFADGKPKLLNSRFTNVWVKGASGWQMVCWQSTPIQG